MELSDGRRTRCRDLPAEEPVQVPRLRAAGAVVLGKTHVPLGQQDIQSFNEIYGATTNPWDHRISAASTRTNRRSGRRPTAVWVRHPSQRLSEDRTPLRPAELLEHKIGGFRAPSP
jgi:hypothetical protein